jgi:hypothetical protein
VSTNPREKLRKTPSLVVANAKEKDHGINGNHYKKKPSDYNGISAAGNPLLTWIEAFLILLKCKQSEQIHFLLMWWVT